MHDKGHNSNRGAVIIRGLRSEPEAEQLFSGGDAEAVLWAHSFGKWAFAMLTAKTPSGSPEILVRATMTAYLTGRMDYRPGRDESVRCADLTDAQEKVGDPMDALL